MCEMSEDFMLKDKRIVKIRDLSIDDFKKNQNYEFVHSWLEQIDKYLGKDFKIENLEQDRQEFIDLISNNDNIFLVGALDQGRIVAFSSLSLNTTLQKEKHVGRWGITVNPEYQNQGIGKKLLSRIEEIAIKRGIKRLEAEFYEGNKSAEILYLKKLNYVLEGRRKFAGHLKDGSYVDKILIGKIIDPSIIDKSRRKN
ncbi:MAG: GNAT family N-acetyltransferase [Promethearchaeota archaeon]|nr:MAG: GNAT family N-acetyltransferase [Candidatus Lokiarchaeota archaeon]